MTEKMFAKTQEQAGRYFQAVTTLTLEAYDFARQEAERQAKLGREYSEVVQQTWMRQWEEAMKLGRSMTELQQGMVKEALEGFGLPGMAKAA